MKHALFTLAAHARRTGSPKLRDLANEWRFSGVEWGQQSTRIPTDLR